MGVSSIGGRARKGRSHAERRRHDCEPAHAIADFGQPDRHEQEPDAERGRACPQRHPERGGKRERPAGEQRSNWSREARNKVHLLLLLPTISASSGASCRLRPERNTYRRNRRNPPRRRERPESAPLVHCLMGRRRSIDQTDNGRSARAAGTSPAHIRPWSDAICRSGRWQSGHSSRTKLISGGSG
jgi:hypothetical protein